jgi:hypothetical protein
MLYTILGYTLAIVLLLMLLCCAVAGFIPK